MLEEPPEGPSLHTAVFKVYMLDFLSVLFISGLSLSMQLSWESVRWLEEHQGADRGRCGSRQVPAFCQLRGCGSERNRQHGANRKLC